MDELLFQSVKEGDVYAFKILFTKYYRKLCKYCFSFVREKETAEEVVSDVFQLLWERKEQIEINTKFSSYLFSFTRNYSLNIVRQRKGAPTFEFIEENSHDEISNMEDPLFWLEQKENDNKYIWQANQLNKMIDDMPHQRKRIFLLHREGVKHKDIAKQLDLSVKTVRNNIEIAIRKLKFQAFTTIEVCILLIFCYFYI